MRKALLYYLLQGTFILPTDCKENLFKGSYNCVGLKKKKNKSRKAKRYLYSRKCVEEEKEKKGKSGVDNELQVKTESFYFFSSQTISSQTIHSNPWFLFFNCTLPKAFGLEVLYARGCPPLQGELHKPDWCQLLRGWPRRSPSHLPL